MIFPWAAEGCSFFLLVRANAQRTLFFSFFGVVTRCVVNLEGVNRVIRVIPFFRAKVESFQSHFPLGARCIRANGKPATSDLDDCSCQQDQLPVCANRVPVRSRGTVLSGPLFESNPSAEALTVLSFVCRRPGRKCGGSFFVVLLSGAQCNRIYVRIADLVTGPSQENRALVGVKLPSTKISCPVSQLCLFLVSAPCLVYGVFSGSLLGRSQ